MALFLHFFLFKIFILYLYLPFLILALLSFFICIIFLGDFKNEQWKWPIFLVIVVPAVIAFALSSYLAVLAATIFLVEYFLFWSFISVILFAFLCLLRYLIVYNISYKIFLEIDWKNVEYEFKESCLNFVTFFSFTLVIFSVFIFYFFIVYSFFI